jgi:AcrR family transcriptional regulator
VASTTRERILDSAVALIMRQGYGGTTVTEIEALAGLSPGSGSFYRHFRSKEHVFTTLFERELERAQEHRRTFERGPVGDDARATLTRRLRQRLDYLTAIQPLIVLLAREHGRFPELTERVRTALLDQGIVEEAEQLAHDLGGRPGLTDPQAMLAVVISALTGYHLSREFFGRYPSGIAPDRFAAALAALLTAGLPHD